MNSTHLKCIYKAQRKASKLVQAIAHIFNVKLSIIIVHYKTPALLLHCLECVTTTIGKIDHEIIVVDNHSEDNSELLIVKQFPATIWLQLASNEGFGRANNAGFKIANGEYLLLLNADAFVLANSISKSLNRIEQDPKIGILGCMLLNEDGSTQKSTYSYFADYADILKENLLLSRLIAFNRSKVKGLMGAFILIPKAKFQTIGGFDEDFFMYFEELDLCRRMTEEGYKLEYFQEAKVIHAQGGSTGNGRWAGKQAFLSHALLYYKMKGFMGYMLFHLLFIVNAAVNFLFLWRMNARYRANFYLNNTCYFSNYPRYFSIPFRFKRQPSSSANMLMN